MARRIFLDGIEELPQLMASIEEDIDQINYAGLLNDELARLSLQHKSYFDSSTGPDGAPWGQNAPSTIRQKGHSRILRGKPSNAFRLMRSLTERTSQSFGDAIREAIQEQPGAAYLSFGSSVEYAGDRFAGRPTAYAPAGRPHVGINSQYLDRMVERAADYTIEQLKKA